jgi:hypothetical protein
MRAIGGRKVAAFGLLAAAGCLAAWGLGEGLLAATAPAPAEGARAASLVRRPDLPAPPPAADRPPPPAAPGAVPPPAPPPPLPPELRARLREAGAHTGDVQLSLFWHNHNDLDLHCVDPAGDEVCYKRKRVGSGGWLDVDRNFGSVTTDAPVENIFWPAGKAPHGEYRVYVHHYAPKPGGADPTRYEVAVKVGPYSLRKFRGAVSHGQPARLVCTFRFPAPDLRLAVPDVVQVNQGGANRLGVKVARENLAGPVRLRFHLPAAGVRIDEACIEAGGDLAGVQVRANDDAPAGEFEARAEASAGGLVVSAPFRVRVRAAPPSLRVALPGAIDVHPGGENRLPVRIRRDRFTGPVTLSGEGPGGVALETTTIPAGQTEAELRLTADGQSAPGEGELKVHAGAAAAAADGVLRVRVHAPPPGMGNWSWVELARIAGWTALLAVGLSAALVVGQNSFLGRRRLGPGLLAVLAGAALAGVVAGGVGQALFAGLAVVRLEPTAGFVAGWLLLGALLGWGVGYVIPNLDGRKAAAAGAVGGAAAAVVFLLAARLGGAAAGRLCGAVLLGSSIGPAAAAVELAFRKAWLEVRYGPREVVTVNLGPEPVKVGSDRTACTVCAAGAAAVALRFWVREGVVYCEDVPARRTTEAAVGRKISVGAVSVTVRSAGPAGPPGPPAPVGVNPPAAPAPAPAARGDVCPGCGAFVPARPGRRECMGCGHIL